MKYNEIKNLWNNSVECKLLKALLLRDVHAAMRKQYEKENSSKNSNAKA